MVIWKFGLSSRTGEQQVEMPAGARLLTVQPQDGAPVLWALCDEGAPRVRRKLWSYLTGDAMLRAWPYVATLQLEGKVLHDFDLGES